MGYLMNIYFIIILVAMIGGYVLDLIADILNLKALKPQPPEDLLIFTILLSMQNPRPTP